MNSAFYYLPVSLFSFFFFRRKLSRLVPFCFCFCGPFSHLYEHAVEHLPQAQHSTAQHSAISPVQSSKASTCRSERDNASKQDRVGESQHVVEHSYSPLCCRNERRNRNLPGLHKYRPSRNSLAGVMREGFAYVSNLSKVQHCSFSPSFFCCMYRVVWYFVYTRMRRPGCFPGAWSSRHLQARQFAPRIVDLSVLFIRILLYSSL